jgi:adenosine deaminase
MMARIAWVAFVATIAGCHSNGPAAPGSAAAACGGPAACEARAAARLDAVRGDPAALQQLLQRLPKGGDLHNHLSGAVYAESYLAWAREDGLRIDDTLSLLVPTQCNHQCKELPASPADARYAEIIRAWSMQDFQATPGGETGHDHFFAAFKKFGAVSHEESREPAMLAEVMRRTADDNAIYLETLVTVARPLVNDIAKTVGPLADAKGIADYERKLRADPRWGELIATSLSVLRTREDNARKLLHCGQADAAPACNLTLRYVGQVGRTSPAGQILAELLVAFEVSRDEPRLAGVNLVSPEDNATAVRDYDLQMTEIGALGAEFAGKSPLRVTLHAGELVPAIVPPEALQFHVRHAVEIARAERIGHGVDVLGEHDAPGLLDELRTRGVTVEVCLSSNASILGVAGGDHPLGRLLAAGVPVALATDDAGVSRSSLTGEMVRAVTVQSATYAQLKTMVRASVTAAFVPGASLWAAPGKRVDACAGSGTDKPSAACAALLAGSERARLQWKLEQQLAAIEAE